MALSDINYLVSLIFNTSRLIRAQMKKRGRVDPFSFLELKVLYYVTMEENPTMANIADCLCIAPPSATPLINRLVKDGALKRIADKNDRRIIHLAITKSGKMTLDKGIKEIFGRMQKILMELSEKERRDLTRILEKLSKIYRS